MEKVYRHKSKNFFHLSSRTYLVDSKKYCAIRVTLIKFGASIYIFKLRERNILKS